MPFFFMISGIFHKYDGKINFETYFKRLLVPTFFYIFLYIFVISFYYYINDKERFDFIFFAENSIKTTIHGILNSTAITNSICWFLIALLNCKIFADVILLVKYKYHLHSVTIILLIIVLSLSIKLYKFPLFISHALMALPFYLLGYYYKDKWKKLKWNNNTIIFLILSLLTTIILTKINGRVSMWALSFGHTSLPWNYFLFYVNGVVGSFFYCVYPSSHLENSTI